MHGLAPPSPAHFNGITLSPKVALELLLFRDFGLSYDQGQYCGVPGLPCLSKSFDSYIDLNFCYPVSVKVHLYED